MQDEKNVLTEEKWYRTKKGKITLISLGCVLFLVGILSLILVLLPDGSDVPPPPETFQSTTEEEKIPGTLAPAVQDDEMRGVYIASVSNLNFPSKKGLGEAELRAELDQIVENSRLVGFDTIFFQVRPTGDALYRSEYFPSSRYLSGTEGDVLPLDPLEYLVTKCAAFDMDVVAWINPYRITSEKAKTKKDALETLASNNPARENPDWTVFYDGRLYYDPARLEVKSLIASGVREICQNYKVKGVLFDDYFYPYPVNGEVFDDRYSYNLASTSLSIEDWRRENVNQMVKLSYDTVKEISPDLTFGISPFGIWKNSSSDPKGSDTKGMEAFNTIYCDALAWIEGGYVDYLAPQIYWEKGHSAADFDTLVRWWSAQVDGTDVELYISHAAYKVEEFELGAQEIIQQLSFSRSWMGVGGNIQYGYAWIKNNTASLRDRLQAYYAEPFVGQYPQTGVKGVVFSRPQQGLKTTTSAQFVSAVSDPEYPVYSQFGKIGRTKNGFFSVYMPLNMGLNTLTVTQNGQLYSLNVTRIESGSSATLLSRFAVKSSSPAQNTMALVASGHSIPLSVTAPAGAQVTAILGDKSISLKKTINPKGDQALLQEVYVGELPVPVVSDGMDYENVGKILFSLKYEDQTLQYTGAQVAVIPANLPVLATVKNDYSHLKISPTSSFYEDYTPASVGMSDAVSAYVDGFYRLGFGGWISEGNLTIEKGKAPASSHLTAASFQCDASESVLKLELGSYPPLDLKVEKGIVTVSLFRTTADKGGNIAIPDSDHLFEKAQWSVSQKETAVVLKLTLLDEQNYYGTNFSYENGCLSVRFTQPQALSDGEKPLEGKVIVLDAGHGGSDPGALGFLNGFHEKNLNLGITLSLQKKLEEMGAKVVLSRSDDTTVSLYERMDLLTLTHPDLSISIHHNSTGESSDANKAAGTLGLYWSEAGYSLSQKVQESACLALGARNLGVKKQMLALCRNHRFPQTLLETSFICSPQEYQFAVSAAYCDLVAEAVSKGVLNWYAAQASFLGR